MEDTKEYMLSTIDNPWNPFKNFDEWFEFDISHNYNTSAYLARIAQTDSEMDDKTFNRKVNEAIDEIIKFNPLPIYIRVSEETDTKTIAEENKEIFNRFEELIDTNENEN